MMKHIKLRFLLLTGPLVVLLLVTNISPCCSAGTRRVSMPCGPGKRCICTDLMIRNDTTRAVKMDCSGKPVRLNDVCNNIKLDRKIVELDVSSINIISRLMKTELRGCYEVHRLSMRHCGISNISDDAFSMSMKLTKLDISGNNLQYLYTGLKPTFLKPVKSLLELSLRVLNEEYENMTLMYPDFSNIGQIERLHIDGLDGTDFPVQYRNITNLKTLIISGSENIFCRMNNLTNKTFENVRFVESLYISQCMITNVEAGTFRALPNLKQLDISLNRQLGFEGINNISYGLQFTNIDFVNYSYNSNTFGFGQMLTKHDVCYLRNTSLRIVALQGVRLELIETNALLLFPPSLEIIYFNDNHFTFGLYLLQLGCLDNLKTYEASFQSISHNPYQYNNETHEGKETRCRKQSKASNCPFLDEQYFLNISKSIDGCRYINETLKRIGWAILPRKLKNFIFSDSHFSFRITIVPLIPLKNTIENVDISGNIFSDLEGPVGPLHSLKYGNLSRNYCTRIGPQFFIYMQNLEVLDMQKNFLGKLLENPASAEIFQPLAKLRSVNLSNNMIKQLAPNICSYMVSLENLDLSYNSIDTWTLDTSNLRNLTHLDLRSNSINTLPESITNQLTEMSSCRKKNFTVDLTNNPIRYSCVHRRFLKWMKTYESHFVNLNEYVFIDDDGKIMKGDRFKEEVKYIDNFCHSYTVAIVLSSVGIAIFLTFIASGMIYKNRWKLRYFMDMNKTRFSGYRSYEPLDDYKYDAFVSYSDENSDFRDAIMKHLEDGGNDSITLKLCIQERDFMPGCAIAENIAAAIQTSNKTIVALSKAYLKSKWCLHEFQMARMESIYSRSGKSIIIVVMLEEVSLDDKMPLELMQWIRHDSYLEYTGDEHGQVVFWDKLKESILE